MNSSVAKKSEAPQPGGKMPGETVRGLVSLWLLFHLLGIVLAMASNTEMGRSQLMESVKRTPFLDQYTYALWLNIPYGYRLIAGELDGDRSIETQLVYADGKRETLPMLPEGAWGERMEHYQAMARRASPADLDSVDSELFKYLGGAILREMKDRGVKEVELTVRRHSPLSMADAAASVSAQRDPFNARTYTDLVTVSVTLNSQDEPQVQVKAQAARDVAPVTNPRGQKRPSVPSGNNSAPTP